MIGVARLLRVVQRRFEFAVRFAPRAGPTIELADRVGFAPDELGTQQVAEQVVIAVPLAGAVEGHEEEVRARERREDFC